MIKKEDIFVNEVYWRNMGEIELNTFADKIFKYYRQEGFPYYPTDKEYREKEFHKLKKFNYNTLWDGDVIKQSMHGLGLAWSYFPHSFNVECNNKITPYEAFMNDDIFMKIIHKRLKMGTYISDSGIRKMLKIYTGVQSVSNFRPTAAACIYDKYAKNGVVWDMSGGWGGRMLGAIIADVHTYITTEPSTETSIGLYQLSKDFGGNMIIEILRNGSEEYLPDKESLDLCFTSPPYFDLEKYADEETQSYKKFSSKDVWVEGFLKPTFENCYWGLKYGKYMLINIADPKGKNSVNLEQETIRIAKDVGFSYIKQHQLALSNVNLKAKNKKYKFEPIFVFQK